MAREMTCLFGPLSRLHHQNQILFSWVSISPQGSFSLFVPYKPKQQIKGLECGLSTKEEEEVVDESRLLSWGYGTELR